MIIFNFMELILSLIIFLKNIVVAVGPFFLLLGVLILIHEWGHFIAARLFGVKVEVFSLGFGPKLLKYKKGDTVYCVSLLPLGGYVKMFGDNPLEEPPDSQKSQGFLYKKVPEKWLIAFAGPFMNLIFTLLAFFILAVYGIPSLPPLLGDVPAQSKAREKGFQSGDRVLSLNGKAISYYGDISEIIKNSPEKTLSFQVQSQTKKIKNIQIQTSLKKNSNPLDWKRSVGFVDGLEPLSTGLRVGIRFHSSARRAGLKTFDEITEVQGKKLKYWRDFKALLKTWDSSKISLTVKRGEEFKNFTLTIPEGLKTISPALLGIEPSDLYVEKVGPGTPAQKAGIGSGDRLLSINQKNLNNWKQVLDTISSSSGQPLNLSYERKGKQKTVLITPQLLFVESNIKKRYMLGIVGGGQKVFADEVLRKRDFLSAAVYSGEETLRWLNIIMTGLVRLIQGEISLRTMGGPVAIGRAAHSGFQKGFASFLFIMALISLNLFFLNLLPIPVLDGGHILFFTMEGILRRPLSVKTLLIAQQIGLFFLLSFMGIVIFNDIYNWLKAW